MGHLSKSAEVMKLVNNLMKAPEVAMTMQEFSKEMTKVYQFGFSFLSFNEVLELSSWLDVAMALLCTLLYLKSNSEVQSMQQGFQPYKNVFQSQGLLKITIKKFDHIYS